MSFGSFFSNIGDAFKHVVNPIYNKVIRPVYEQAIHPAVDAGLGFVKQNLPMLGTMAGGAIGGPMGAMAGQNITGMLQKFMGGGGGGDDQQQQQQQQGQLAPAVMQQDPSQGGGGVSSIPGLADIMQRYGNQFSGAVNNYLPEQFQNQDFGNIGQAGGDYLGDKMGNFADRFGMGDMARRAGSYLGERANSYIQPHIPSYMQNMPMGDMGGFAQRGLGDWMNRRLGGGDNQQFKDFQYEQPTFGLSPEQGQESPPPLPQSSPYRDAYSASFNEPPAQDSTRGFGNPMEELSRRFAQPNMGLRHAPPMNPYSLPPSPFKTPNIMDQVRQRGSMPNMGLRQAPPPLPRDGAALRPGSGGLLSQIHNRGSMPNKGLRMTGGPAARPKASGSAQGDAIWNAMNKRRTAWGG